MPRKPGAQHKYREIADDLRRRIKSGEFDATRKLSTERELSERYGASQMTVRQALAVLRDEGLVESRVGSGWRLTEWRPIVRNALKRLSPEEWGEAQSMWEVDIEDRDLVVADVQIEQLPAPDEVARALDVEAGELVWKRGRRYLVEGVPVMRATSYIPDEFARGTRITQVDTGPGGIYERFRDAGHGPLSFREQVRCRLATPGEVDDLALAAGAPVIEQHRYARRPDGVVVEVNRMILDASRYLLQYDI
ncbi:GntR family transcriptional regulator [Streptomyces sp. AA1529]|uniref:GntR family transcriptional regulator n=1 Tax=Streptomyces sp. AA1529 TaxID=1203257 RepID=UPI00031F1EEB|nr:GntR family transcriptional regulator [Streptomyces sp. AA1529]